MTNMIKRERERERVKKGISEQAGDCNWSRVSNLANQAIVLSKTKNLSTVLLCTV